jgi:branched-chain amino acid transport system ATP-binding protein
MTEVLRLQGVTVGYGAVPVNHTVDLRAEAGAITALIGPNGAGKSTLLKATAGLLRPSAGTVTVDGLDVTGWRPHRIVRVGMGYVPQVSNVFPTLTVTENLEVGAYVRRSGKRERMDEVLEMFPDLRQAARLRAGALSGGQRTMLAIARALMLDPKVLLLDEPTGGLAPMYIDRVWEKAVAIARAGTGVVVVEQNVDLALEHADHAYILIAGRNYIDGRAAEVSRLDLGAIFLGKNPGEPGPADTVPQDGAPTGGEPATSR